MMNKNFMIIKKVHTIFLARSKLLKNISIQNIIKIKLRQTPNNI